MILDITKVLFFFSSFFLQGQLGSQDIPLVEQRRRPAHSLDKAYH